MATGLEDKLARPEDDRGGKVESPAAQLIAEETARRQLRPTNVAPDGARGRQA